eukprot:6184119-Pleurochrysis_carterae.AAC.5
MSSIHIPTGLSRSTLRKSSHDCGLSHPRFPDISNVSCVPVETASTTHANRQTDSNQRQQPHV